MTEQELIIGLKNRQEDAFKVLVETRQAIVYNTILGFLQNPMDAEDVTQDVFIKIYESIGQFKGESALTTWVYRVAVTSSLEFIRRKKRKKRFGFISPLWGEDNEQTVELPDFHHPGVLLDQREMSATLFKAITNNGVGIIVNIPSIYLIL